MCRKWKYPFCKIYFSSLAIKTRKCDDVLFTQIFLFSIKLTYSENYVFLFFKLTYFVKRSIQWRVTSSPNQQSFEKVIQTENRTLIVSFPRYQHPGYKRKKKYMFSCIFWKKLRGNIIQTYHGVRSSIKTQFPKVKFHLKPSSGLRQTRKFSARKKQNSRTLFTINSYALLILFSHKQKTPLIPRFSFSQHRSSKNENLLSIWIG